ncbi:MAG: putative sulfate exporter family transporter [Pseudomonadota bacterium]
MRRDGEEAAHPAAPLLPMFLIAFVGLMVINSAGLVPMAVQSGLSEASRWALIAAVAALGVKTSLSDLFKVGPNPVAVLTLQTLMLAAFALVGLTIFIQF